MNTAKILTNTIKNYLTRKKNKTKEETNITKADVKNQYPSLKRILIKISLEDCLKICTNYNSNKNKQLIDTVMFCLEKQLCKF